MTTKLHYHLVLAWAVLQRAVVDFVVDDSVPSQHPHCLCGHTGRLKEKHLEEAGSASLLKGKDDISDISDNSGDISDINDPSDIVVIMMTPVTKVTYRLW